MRIMEMMLLCLVCLLLLIGTRSRPVRQAQEASVEEDSLIVEDGRKFSVVYRSESPADEPVIDILWMKRAAQIAIDEGIPHFNVLHQKISSNLRQKYNQHLSTVEGVILLESDPMKAEYDAQEIDSLVLTEQVVDTKN